MISWFQKRKTKRLIEQHQARLEENRKNGLYTLGTFESSDDAKELSEDSVSFFPDLKEVLVADQIEDFSQHLKPLCSIPMSVAHTGISVKAHFIASFREYYEAPVEEHYNEYCYDNVLAFKLENDKVRILGGEGLFQTSSKYAKYKVEFEQAYERSKTRFHDEGMSLFNVSKMSDLIRQVGSKPMWVQSDQDLPNHKSYLFIGQVNCMMFGVDGPYIFLFYDQENEVFYQVEQYT